LQSFEKPGKLPTGECESAVDRSTFRRPNQRRPKYIKLGDTNP
jgi:hypothetical protein